MTRKDPVRLHYPAQVHHHPPPRNHHEVSDVLLSIEHKLSALDNRIALIEVLHHEFQALRQSLEYSQDQIDMLARENKTLQHSVSKLTTQLTSNTAEHKK